MSFKKIIPTKTQLMKLEKRISFLQKGHNLLEIKAETLIVQIKKFYKQVKQRRDEVLHIVNEAFSNLKKAEISSGEHFLKSLADVNRDLIQYSIKTSYRSSFGFTIPKIDVKIDQKKKYPHYGFLNTNIFLDDYTFKIQEGIHGLIKLAELEATLFIMVEEYKKIRRRIKALEEIIIPQTAKQIKDIKTMIEATQMEEFIRLKKIKEKITKREAEVF